MKKFLKEVGYCFYPPKYKELKDKGFRNSYKFALKVLFMAFLIAAILLIPQFASMKSEITNDLAKINVVNISGSLEATDSISIPSTNPIITIDLENDPQLNKEIFLITKEKIKYRFFGKREIETSKLKNPQEHNEEVGRFATSIAFLLVPGFAVIMFFKAAIKYFLITILFGTIIFFLMDLTHYKIKFKKMLTIAAFASVPIILIETIFAAINPSLLLPFMRFIGLNIYTVTLAIWFGYIIICVIFLKDKLEKEDE